jgi:hypothetical protein
MASREVRVEKTASRTLSAVGLVPASGTFRFLPLSSPAMILVI